MLKSTWIDVVVFKSTTTNWSLWSRTFFGSHSLLKAPKIIFISHWKLLQIWTKPKFSTFFLNLSHFQFQIAPTQDKFLDFLTRIFFTISEKLLKKFIFCKLWKAKKKGLHFYITIETARNWEENQNWNFCFSAEFETFWISIQLDPT